MTSTSLHTGKKHYMAPWVTRAESCGPGDVEAKRTLAASSTEDFLIGRWSLVFCLLARVRHQKACWKLCVCRQNMSFLNWSSWGCKPAFMFRDPQIPLSEVLFSQGTCCLFFWKESSIFLSWGTRLVVKFSEAKKKKERARKFSQFKHRMVPILLKWCACFFSTSALSGVPGSRFSLAEFIQILNVGVSLKSGEKGRRNRGRIQQLHVKTSVSPPVFSSTALISPSPSMTSVVTKYWARLSSVEESVLRGYSLLQALGLKPPLF